MSAFPLPREPTSWRSPCIHPAAAAIVSLLLAASGVVLLGQGLWIHATPMLAQVLLERACTGALASGQVVKPWPWADTWPIARIEVPRLGKSAIVLHGTSGQALAFGPGHVERTPDAGERGTAVYSAHRDTHFAFVGEVKIGDDILVTRTDGATFHFRVTALSVAPWDASGIDADAEGRHLVLSTCWPLTAKFSGPWRYLVRAEIADGAAAGG